MSLPLISVFSYLLISCRILCTDRGYIAHSCARHTKLLQFPAPMKTCTSAQALPCNTEQVCTENNYSSFLCSLPADRFLCTTGHQNSFLVCQQALRIITNRLYPSRKGKCWKDQLSYNNMVLFYKQLHWLLQELGTKAHGFSPTLYYLHLLVVILSKYQKQNLRTEQHF